MLASIDELVQMDTPPTTAEEREQQQRDEHSVAEMMVGNWNFNRGLYRKYGGRVVFQQAGMEAVDGHKAFLKELRASGAYRILDPAYQGLFKETDEYFGKEFEYLDSTKANEYFATPWWLQDAATDPAKPLK